MKRKAQPHKKGKGKKAKPDPLARWALEPGFKMNLKRSDQSVAAFFTTTTSTAGILLNTIAQGVGDNMRVGQRIRMFNMTVRGEITFFPSATSISQPDSLRLIIVYDRQTNGSGPIWSNVITNIAAGTSNNLDPPNWYERGRYKILRDWLVPVPAISATVAAGVLTAATTQLTAPSPTSEEFHLHFFKPLKGKLDTIYSGTGSSAANINGGGIFVFGQSGQAGANNWAYSFTSTIEYMDV